MNEHFCWSEDVQAFHHIHKSAIVNLKTTVRIDLFCACGQITTAAETQFTDSNKAYKLSLNTPQT